MFSFGQAGQNLAPGLVLASFAQKIISSETTLAAVGSQIPSLPSLELPK
jgi:hypothetical protein